MRSRAAQPIATRRPGSFRRLWLLFALACLASAGLVERPAPGVALGSAGPAEGGGSVMRAASDQGILTDGRAGQRLVEQRRLRQTVDVLAGASAAALVVAAEDGFAAAPTRDAVPAAPDHVRALGALDAHRPRAPPA